MVGTVDVLGHDQTARVFHLTRHAVAVSGSAVDNWFVIRLLSKERDTFIFTF